VVYSKMLSHHLTRGLGMECKYQHDCVPVAGNDILYLHIQDKSGKITIIQVLYLLIPTFRNL
jgi:hypothetical protein